MHFSNTRDTSITATSHCLGVGCSWEIARGKLADKVSPLRTETATTTSHSGRRTTCIETSMNMQGKAGGDILSRSGLRHNSNLSSGPQMERRVQRPDHRLATAVADDIQ